MNTSYYLGQSSYLGRNNFITKAKQINSQSFNFDVEFCRHVLPYNHILCLHHFNLRFLYLQSLQSLLNWIQFTLQKPKQCALNFTEQMTRAHLLLLQPSIRSIPSQIIYCGKGRQNFASNVTLYPCERSRQNHLAAIKWKLKVQWN